MKNLKNCLLFFALTLLITMTVIITAAAGTYYGDLTYSVSGGEVTITDCKTSATSVVIPENINGYPVTSIGPSAFHSCTSLTSVTIPNSVASIGSEAFRSCTSLTSVTIPDSVTSIGSSAFYSCTSLNSVTIPNSVTSIGSLAFHSCTSLTSVTIPDSVTSIGDMAFCDCDSLTNIIVSSDNKNYTSDSGVLFNKNKTTLICYPCGKKLAEYIIPNSVTSIGSYAFYGCTSLNSVTIPNSVTSIGSYAFEDCTSLNSVTIPNSVTSIGYSAFRSCTSLTNIIVNSDNKNYTSDSGVLFNKNKTTLICYPCGKKLAEYIIPNSVTSIGSFAFEDCTSLNSVTIPDSVTSIGYSAFEDCTSLTSVTIPNSVTSIGSYAFRSCKSLVTVYNNSNLSLSLGDSGYGYVAYYAYKLVNKDGSVVYRSGYTDDGNGFLFDSSNRLCAYVGSEDTVTLPNTYKGNTYSIYRMKGVINVIIPNSVTSIGSEAFRSCKSLTNIIVNSDNKNYTSDSGVLFNKNKTTLICYPCGKKLAEYIIPNSVTSIGDYAFYDCDSLTSITIPQSVTSIGSCAIGYYYNNAYKIYDDFVIRGYTYSYGEKYANNNGIEFVSIGKLSYPVTFNANGGNNAPESQKKIHNEALTLTTDIPIRTDYTFMGWATSSNGSVEYSAGGTYTSNSAVTLYAVWEINKYSVTYNANGGDNAPGTQTKVHFEDLVLSTKIPTRTGYTFKGWATSADGDVEYAKGSTYTSNAPLTLYAVWEINKYSVTYNANGGENAPEAQTKVHFEDLTLSADIPTRTDYTFKGWATSSSGSVEYSAGGTYTGNSAVTLYAVWEINKYSVTYNANGGDNTPGTQTKVHFEDLTLSTKIPTRTGYTFKGWATSSDGIVEYDPGETYTNNAPLTLYAVWEINRYSVTYNANGGENAPEAQTKVHFEDLTLSSDILTRTGYTFMGWATSSNGSVEYSAGGTYTGNSAITLYAVWEPHRYTVTFDANRGSNAPATQEKIHDKVLTLTNNAPTLKYYKCVGWSTTPDGEVEYARGGRYENEEPITLYAVWEIDYPVSDSCGANVRWTLNSSGVLTISGSGAMDNWNNATETPWYTINYAIKSIVIGSGVTSVSTRAFEGTPFYEDEENWTKGVLYVGDCLIDAKPTVSGLYRVAMGTRLIACDAFIDCNDLTDIVIPKSVTSINSHSLGFYYDCEYKLRDSFKVYGFASSQTETHCLDNELWFVEYDGYYGDCGAEVVWELVDGVLTISGNGEMADYTANENAPWKAYVGKIKSVVINEGVTNIGKQAFHSCTRIETVTLPDSLEAIGAYAFYKCEKLTEIAVPDSVTSIGNAAFSGCDNIVINCSKGSYAETYAKNNSISYKSGECGDVNGDNVVDLKDVTTLRRYLAGGYSVTVVESALDVNGNGEIDLKDVTYLRRALAGGYGIELK